MNGTTTEFLHMDRKDKYRALCTEASYIPLFARDWWLDAVAGSANWDVALVEQGEQIIASMPYTLSRVRGRTYLGQPNGLGHVLHL